MKEYYFDEMIVRRYTWDIIDSNSYLIIENNEAILIDICDSEELLNDLISLDKIYIFLTHSHFDHISGLNQLRKNNKNSLVYSTLNCSKNIGNKYKNMSASANAYLAFYNKDDNPLDAINKLNIIDSFECEVSDVTFDESYSFYWNDHFIQLFSVYGHSNDGILLIIDRNYMFSGDTLLPIPTITRFVGGSTKLFWEHDIPLLKSLAPSIKKVFPGHGEPGELKEFISKNSSSK